MAIEIRTVPAESLRTWAESVSFANSEELSEETWRDVEPTVEQDRTFGAYDGETLVGGGSIFSFDLTVPGERALSSAGVTWVGIMPTHRRQGALRMLMTRMLEDARGRNEPLAVLWASEGSIYQRFGYGLSTLVGVVDLEHERAVLRSTAPARGSVRLIEADEAARLFPPIFEANRLQRPGFYTRNEVWWRIEVLADFKWARRGMDRKFYALHETDGRPDAYAMYRVSHAWPENVPASQLHLQEIMAIDGDALREMWRFIFGVDLIKRIKTRASDPNEPLLHMVHEPRRVGLRISDGLWLRIVDVRAALEGRGYSADGTLVFDVADDFLPDQAGRWRLTTSGGSGQVERTDAPADLEIETNDLGAVYLGAFTFDRLAQADRTTELTSGARARADAMFHSPADAWCPQVF